MTVPSPARLAESLTDVGRGFTAEMPGLGTPDPALGRHIIEMARRITNRVRLDDPRLAAFAPWTDTRGYTWFDQSDDLHPVLTRAAREHWSFERWFTTLAQTIAARTSTPTADELAQMAADAERIEQATTSGYRITYAGPGGFILGRDGAGA